MARVNANEAVAAVVSSITIKNGSTVLVTDNFSGSTLDTNKWSNLDGINTIYNGDLAYYLSWNTPNDQGFAALQTASSLNGSWKDMSTAANWLFINGSHTVPITKSGMQAQLGETGVAFFRLIKRTYTQLQVLVPGETAAPNTPTGKTGTPILETNGMAFDVIVNAVDATFNVCNNSDQVQITDPSDANFLCLNGTDITGTMLFMANGTATFSVEFTGNGSSQMIVTDQADTSKIGTSSMVTY